MPDPLDAALDRLDTIRSNLLLFQRRNDAGVLEDCLEQIEELHDDIEDIIEDSD